MGQVVYVLGLFLIAGVLSISSADQYPEKNVRKSSLILEYNWPEPSKSLNRLPHPRSCHHFVHTKHNGKHVVKRCHGDKIFDYRSLRCQSKSTAKCWMNIVKKGNIKKVKRPFSCPFPWGLYPDKEDCSLFYDCMGGKIYPRKCPDSTLFDVVERICVHSKKALCARDSDEKDFKTADSAASIEEHGHAHGRNKIHNLGRGQSEHGKKWSWKSGNDKREDRKDIIAKDRDASQTLVLFRTTPTERDMFSVEDSSDEVGKKHRTKSKNQLITSKFSSISTDTAIPKLLKKTDVDSEEDSSEEMGGKYQTKSENKLITSRSPLVSTDAVNPEEENSSEEEYNKINLNYELKSKTPKLQSSSYSDYSKKLASKIYLSSTEKQRITPPSQSIDSTELPIQSTIIKSVNTENELKPSSIITSSEDTEKNENLNDNTEQIFFPTERMLKKHTSSEEPYSHASLKQVKITVVDNKANGDINHEIAKVTWPTESTPKEFSLFSELSNRKKTDSTLKNSFTPNAFTVHPTVTENLVSESETTTINLSCRPEPKGFRLWAFPYPNSSRLYIDCTGGRPTVKECIHRFIPGYGCVLLT